MPVPSDTPSRRGGLLLAAVVSLISAGRGANESKPTRPNILFILADDMGWTAPACYGNTDVPTPHIDRLAAEGMRFTQAYADAQCSPTRAAFLSGQYGARTGVFKVIHEKEPPRAYLRPPAATLALPPDRPTLPGVLRTAGYATGLSGKWHVADAYHAAELRDRDSGRYFQRYGFDFCGPADERNDAEKAAAAITDDIIGFIERERQRPWFAYVAHFTPHTRLLAPADLVAKHAARGYARTTNPNGKYSERPTAEYLAMLEYLDAQVGRLLRRLDELELTRHTLVVFASDNGGLTRVASCAPLREGKGSPYEGGIRVPLIVRWPGVIRAGSVSETPTHTIDFFPTFIEVAGARAPDHHVLDGESMLPVWREVGSPRSNRTLGWHMPTYTTNYGRTPCAVLRRGEWKLIHWFGDYLDPAGFTPDDRPYGKLKLGARSELYQLHDDPGETRDLSSRFPERTAELRRTLEAWWADTGAPFPARNPDYDPEIWWFGERDFPRSKTPD